MSAREWDAHAPEDHLGRIVCSCGDFDCASLTTVCAAPYGQNPYLCHRDSGHEGAHSNRYGTTWMARADQIGPNHA